MNYKVKEKNILISFIMIAFFSSLIIGEGLIRIVSEFNGSYIVEMIKYSHELIMDDPEGVIAKVNRPNASSRLMNIEFKLNSLGHRSSELTTPKPLHEKRIFVLGSSETIGWGIEQNKTYVAQLERLLNSENSNGITFKTINAGSVNYSAKEIYTVLTRQFDLVNPDLVIINYYFSDKVLKKSNSYFSHNFYLISYLNALWDSIETNKQKKELREIYQENGELFKNIINNFNQIKNFCNDKKIPFKIVMLPDLRDLKKDSDGHKTFQEIEKNLVSANITELINLWDTLQNQYANQEEKAWISPRDGHPNEIVHAMMAQEIYKNLKESKTLIQ